MKIKEVPSSWLIEEEHRLDCSPFTSGGIEARKAVESLECRKDHLSDLTLHGIDGMYHVGQDKIRWVESAEHGMPFLRSSDILLADLSNASLISRRQVEGNPLFQCPQGTTLITRSGSIGRMMYARREIADSAISQDVLKVVPDSSKVQSGYLYAYLSSRFGLPQIISGTFGSIIVHIEAENIADLVIPRLGSKVEQQCHALMEACSRKRTEAADAIASAVHELTSELGLKSLSHSDVSRFGIATVQAANLNGRLDAFYHSAIAKEAEEAIATCNADIRRLSDVTSRLFKPPIFKRIWVDDSSYGRQFVSGTDAYRFSAEELRFVSRKTPGFSEFIVHRGWLVFQAAGQVYGLFGQPLFVCGWLEGLFCADDIYRIVPRTSEDGGFLYAYFKTPHGQILLKRQACGNSIPRVWDPHMEEITVPWPAEAVRRKFGTLVIGAHEKLEEARISEEQAIHLVEDAIEKVGGS